VAVPLWLKISRIEAIQGSGSECLSHLLRPARHDHSCRLKQSTTEMLQEGCCGLTVILEMHTSTDEFHDHVGQHTPELILGLLRYCGKAMETPCGLHSRRSTSGDAT